MLKGRQSLKKDQNSNNMSSCSNYKHDLSKMEREREARQQHHRHRERPSPETSVQRAIHLKNNFIVWSSIKWSHQETHTKQLV